MLARSIDKPPLVSVIICTYGRAECLEQAVNSVLTQDYPAIELVVVDDNGRGAPSQLAVQAFLSQVHSKCYRLKYVVNEHNGGVAFSRNNGLRRSSGALVCFLDDDDLFTPGSIRSRVSIFENLDDKENPIGFVCGDYTRFEGEPLLAQTATHFSTAEVNTNDCSLIVNYIGPPGVVMFQNTVLNEVQGFDPQFRYRDDCEIYFRISLKYRIIKTDFICLNYRIHGGSLSANPALVYQDLVTFKKKHHTAVIASKNRNKFFSFMATKALENRDVKGALLCAINCTYDQKSDLMRVWCKVFLGVLVLIIDRR